MGLRRVVGDIAAAWFLLLRIPFPVPDRWRDPSSLADGAWAYPLIGVLVGVVGGAAYFICGQAQLSPVFCSSLALAAMILVTGALHEDGFADFWDSFGGRDKNRRLEIMRDSQIGTFGALGLIFSVGLRWGAIHALQDPGIVFAALISAGALSRVICLFIMRFLEPARRDGLGASANGLSLPVLVIGGGVALAIIFSAMSVLPALYLVGVILTVSALMIAVAKKRFGGYTGDVLGAGQQFGEIAILILAAVLFS